MDKKNAKAIYWNVGLGLTALCFVLSFFYCPYAYSHHLSDFHLTDCYTSFFGVPIIVCLTQVFYWKASENEKWSIPRNIIYAVLVLFVWELVDGLLAKRMDRLDIMASVISGCLMYVAYLIFGFKKLGEYKE